MCLYILYNIIFYLDLKYCLHANDELTFLAVVSDIVYRKVYNFNQLMEHFTNTKYDC